MTKRHYRVTWADAIRGHEEALQQAGGAPGIVNEHAILSAIARPYHGYHRFIYQKAAALLHGVVSAHGFADGNKRTALYLVNLLVRRSGYELVEDNMIVAEIIISVARGGTSCEELAGWLKGCLIPLKYKAQQ